MAEQPIVPVRVRRVSGELRELRRRHGLESLMSGAHAADLRWRRSSRSTSKPNCAEVAFAGEAVAARDSKHREGAVLAFSRADWSSLLDAVRADHFGG